MGLHITAVVLGLTLTSVAVRAQSSEYEACLAKAPSSTQRFQCNQSEMQRQDRRVDADYRKLQIRFEHDQARQAEVRTDQRDWLTHRDAVCRKRGESEDFACMIRETAAKADQLDGRLR